MQSAFPNGKRFAFTIFDDTDNATVDNVRPVYDLLKECGIRSTKSVWVFPPRGDFSGSCLQDPEYRDFVVDLQRAGFEIALHNVGDGSFSREEIRRGFDLFKQAIGHYPRSHTNHVSNPDNLYWWNERFEWPFSALYSLASGKRSQRPGNDPASPHFWGDLSKTHVKYIRNLTFNSINTTAIDSRMPYQERRKAEFSNFWFSSSDGHTVREMNSLISRRNIDRLEEQGGACIVYTHFASGYVDENGNLNSEFEKSIRYLAAKDGWFVPVCELLDSLLESSGRGHDPGYFYKLKLNVRWFLDRLVKQIRY